MTRFMRVFLFVAAASILLITGALPCCAETPDKGIRFETDRVWATLEGVPIRAVLEEIKKEKGIWFENKGDESLLEQRVSIQFSDVPLVEALKRLLAFANYVLTFDPKGKAAGLILLGKKDPIQNTSTISVPQTGQASPPEGPSQDRRERTNPTTQEQQAKTQPPQPFQTRPDGLVKIDSERIDISSQPLSDERGRETSGQAANSGRVGYGAPAQEKAATGQEPTQSQRPSHPGDSAKPSREELQNFQVTPQSQPPGGTVTVSPEHMGAFRHVGTSPGPGGSVTVTSDHLGHFKEIRNTPQTGSKVVPAKK